MSEEIRSQTEINGPPGPLLEQQPPFGASQQSSTVIGSPPEAANARPRKPRRKKRAVWIALAVIVVVLIGVGYIKRDGLMRIISARADDPGSGQQPSPGVKAELKVLYWQDPMHPAYKSDKPGKAPDCGMDLVPVYENTAGAASNLPEGAFEISPQKQQLIGVTYGEAAYSLVSKTLRAVARLTYDETKIVRIHTKTEGWIENVYVDFTGKQVNKGQPLISIYSPDLVQTQQEYLLALKGRTELSESPFREAVTASESLYQSARRRLELWDISEAQIKDLELRGKPTKALTLYAPANGFVLARNAYPKQRVTPETELYQIADLSTIWAIADIYEYEAPEIKIGQPATLTLSYYPGKPLKGQVSYIYPQLDNATRTLKVRIEFPNADFSLKPDMYANVELKIDYGKRLVVPQEAVLDSGSEQTVFVALEGGYFEPRKVQLGAKVENKFIVLAGLKPGERIVTSANFLIDSESRLKSAAGGMGMPGMSHGSGGESGGQKAPEGQLSGQQPGAQPSPRARPEDHSQHQPTKQEQSKPDDHSKHRKP
ncbi:MAG TPA: efflux RND transporter periplasmic adaptor subunit [Blastocatellia bacterium]|nr:efflux RND transporter periplasmic adaptor subunit [Blastocatellia bacterium]